MKVNIEDIKRQYRGTASFVGTPLFKLFYEVSLNEDGLYDKLVFCNDYLGIPPVEVFVKRYKNEIIAILDDRAKERGVDKCEFEQSEKQGLGACLGFIFKNILGYKTSETKWVGDKTSGIRNGSLFSNREVKGDIE